MKEQNKTPEKELNKMKISNLSDAEIKTLAIRMLKELIRYFNSIKKTQTEIKFTLSEIILQESTMEWMKQRNKSMIGNIRKKKTFNQEEKRIKTKQNKIG